MALTKEQKEELDKALIKVVSTNGNKYRYTKESLMEQVSAEVDFEFTYQSLPYAMERARIQATKISTIAPEFYLSRVLYRSLSAITKKKNLLVFTCAEGKEITYDFNTKTFSTEIQRSECDSSTWYAITIVKDTPEWIINYIPLDSDYFGCKLENVLRILNKYHLLNEMPKGLYPFIESNGGEIDEDVIKEYLIQTTLSGSKRYVDFMLTVFGIEILLQYKDIFINVFNEVNCKKILISTAKSFESWNNRDFGTLIRKIIYCNKEIPQEDFIKALDFNRSVKYNLTILEGIENSIKYKVLQAQLQRLNFINGLTFDEYIVVVPQTKQDNIAEGQMQNNCVGSFYDNSIIEGENLIYFLRLKSKPEKSLVTCRYDVGREKSVECKRKNNTNITLTDKDVIKQIDKIINEHFAQAEGEN